MVLVAKTNFQSRIGKGKICVKKLFLSILHGFVSEICNARRAVFEFTDNNDIRQTIFFQRIFYVKSFFVDTLLSRF
jgi:hypothetical protein